MTSSKPILGVNDLQSQFPDIAGERNWLIISEVMGKPLGISRSTISSKGVSFRKLGFEFEKVKEGSTTLWRVRQY